jgi:hypothetical protein
VGQSNTTVQTAVVYNTQSAGNAVCTLQHHTDSTRQAGTEFALDLSHTLSSGTAAANLGTQIRHRGVDDGGTLRQQVNVFGRWNSAAAATFAATWGIGVAAGGVSSSGTNLNFEIAGTSTSPVANIGLCLQGAAGSYGSGKGVVFVRNCNTAPSVTPTNGAIIYSDTGRMKIREDETDFIVLANAATKVVAGAPYANDGYVVVRINGTNYKMMTTA